MKTCLHLFLATCALSAGPASAQHLYETISNTGGLPGRFAGAVAYNGDLAVVRALVNPPPGSSTTRQDVHVLRRDGFSFDLEDVIIGPTFATGISFGFSLAANEDQIMVGVPIDPVVDGSVYVFDNVGGQWTHTETVVPLGASATNGFYGFNIAVDGSTMMIAAPFARPPGSSLSEGLVFVYENSPGGWQEVAVLTAPPSMAGTFFGTGLDLDGDVAVIGGSDYTPVADRTGGAWIFRRVGGVWGMEQELLPPTPVNDEGRFGSAASIDGDRAVVAARNESVGGVQAAGAAHIFERSAGVWSEVALLTSPTPTHFGSFADALCIDGDQLVVGSDGEGALTEGAAFTYYRDAIGWNAGPVLLSPIPAPSAGTRFFGAPVHVKDNTALIGDVGMIGSGEDVVRVFDLNEGTTRYCSSVPNNTGGPALIYADGPRDVDTNQFRLRATSVSGGFGLVFYGVNALDAPFGVGRRCVGGQTYRLRVVPVVDETLIEVVDFNMPPNAGGTITASSTWHFQAWFRDPAPTSPGFNTSDGIAVTF